MLVPYQSGGFPVFVGSSLPQHGRGFGSVMSSLFRNLVVPAAKSVGKSLLRTGLRKSSNIMRGVADGKNIKQAVMEEITPIAKVMRRVAHKPRKPVRSGITRVTKRNPPAGRGRGRGRKRGPPARRGPPAKRARSDIFG